VNSVFAPRNECTHIQLMVNSVQVFEEARRAGIDLDLLDSNPALSVGERWKQHDAALALALKLEQAGRARDAKLRPTAAKAD